MFLRHLKLQNIRAIRQLDLSFVTPTGGRSRTYLLGENGTGKSSVLRSIAFNPLWGLMSDARSVSSLLGSIKTPVILVGHSYGGNVISNAANGHANVKGLVFVAAFAPEAGESAVGLSGKYPGATLGEALSEPVVQPDGSKDLYIDQRKFHDQFAADVSEDAAKLMAAAQRPITQGALEEASGQPAWKNIPLWFVFGSADKNIPPVLLREMAKRSSAIDTIEVKGASHVVMVSNPVIVAGLIEKAAKFVENQK